MIESPFATVRLHERVILGAGSRTKRGPAGGVQLLDMAQLRWRRLDRAHLLPLARAGAKFVDGVRQDRLKNFTHSSDNRPREAV